MLLEKKFGIRDVHLWLILNILFIVYFIEPFVSGTFGKMDGMDRYIPGVKFIAGGSIFSQNGKIGTSRNKLILVYRTVIKEV